jgi:hypothetical protein
VDQDQARRVAGALLNWAAALGDPAAHRELARLMLDGTLPPPPAQSADEAAFRHLKLAEKLLAEKGEADPAPDKTKELAAKLTPAELAAVTEEVARWTKEPFTADPPWLRIATK